MATKCPKCGWKQMHHPVGKFPREECPYPDSRVCLETQLDNLTTEIAKLKALLGEVKKYINWPPATDCTCDKCRIGLKLEDALK